MKLSLPTIALVAATTVTALPFWSSNNNKDIPSLTVEEWTSIHDGSFAPIIETGKKYHHRPSSVWDQFKSLSPFSFGTGSIEGITEAIEEALEKTVDSYDDDSQKTIWQLIQEDDKFTKLVKALKIEETGKAIAVLDDQDKSITFFAPEDSGIPDPPHKKPEDDDEDIDSALQVLSASPSLDSVLHFHAKHIEDKKPSDEDKERRHKIFQFILRSVLKYHGIKEALSSTELASNNSVATALVPKFGTNDGEPLRIHLEKKLVPPSLELNFYSKVSSADNKAKNGYYHAISKPLLPPPSILDELFLFPKEFSILTSAIQKVGGDKYVEWGLDYEKTKEAGKPVFKGTPATTVFAPTNAAFSLLPDRLLHFLFSPFGGHVLAKLLSYHALPRNVIFSEKFWDTKAPKDDKKALRSAERYARRESKRDWFAGLIGLDVDDEDPSFHEEWTLETGLKNASVKVVVDKSKIVPIPGATKTTFTVNDIEASKFDIPALNGALHVLPKVLKPPHKHEDKVTGRLVDSEWEDWEDWLVDWADSTSQ